MSKRVQIELQRLGKTGNQNILFSFFRVVRLRWECCKVFGLIRKGISLCTFHGSLSVHLFTLQFNTWHIIFQVAYPYKIILLIFWSLKLCSYAAIISKSFKHFILFKLLVLRFGTKRVWTVKMAIMVTSIILPILLWAGEKRTFLQFVSFSLGQRLFFSYFLSPSERVIQTKYLSYNEPPPQKKCGHYLVDFFFILIFFDRGEPQCHTVPSGW